MLIEESPAWVIPGEKGGEYIEDFVVVGIGDAPFESMELGQVTT